VKAAVLERRFGIRRSAHDGQCKCTVVQRDACLTHALRFRTEPIFQHRQQNDLAGNALLSARDSGSGHRNLTERQENCGLAHKGLRVFHSGGLGTFAVAFTRQISAAQCPIFEPVQVRDMSMGILFAGG
jgi:hypothetical protein